MVLVQKVRVISLPDIQSAWFQFFISLSWLFGLCMLSESLLLHFSMVDVRILCHQSVFIDQYFALVQWLLTLHRNLCPESKLHIFYHCYHYLTSVKEEGGPSYKDASLPVTFGCCHPVMQCLRWCVSPGNPGRMGVRLLYPSRCLLQDVVYPRLAGFQRSHCANITTRPFLISSHRHLSRFWWFDIFYMACVSALLSSTATLFQSRSIFT